VKRRTVEEPIRLKLLISRAVIAGLSGRCFSGVPVNRELLTKASASFN
jgi:hypothetical protein